jgi:lipopolysaccharide cholinephosphotransferase
MDEFFFSPSLFNEPDCNSNRKLPNDIKIYTEEEVLQLDEFEPFWRTPMLNNEQLKMLYKLAETICDVFQRRNVEIWMDGGTLLGSIRHGGLIPWDDDMDFATFKCNKKIFETEIVPDLDEIGYGVTPWWYGGYRIFDNKGSVLALHPDCKYPFADLFFVQMSKKDKNLIEYVNNYANSLWPSGLTVQDLRPLKMGPFGRLELPMPHNPEPHLQSLYGERWMSVVYRDYNHFNSKYYDRVYVQLKSFAPALPDCDNDKVTCQSDKEI